MGRRGRMLILFFDSFGTIVEAGSGLITLFNYLAEAKLPFIYAGGNQIDALPKEARAALESTEKDGRAIAPDWLDQIGLLSHTKLRQ